MRQARDHRILPELMSEVFVALGWLSETTLQYGQVASSYCLRTACDLGLLLLQSWNAVQR